MRITILLLLFCTKCYSQDTLRFFGLPHDGEKVAYTNILELKGVKKQDLFIKTKDVAVDLFVSQKAAVEAEDKDAGYIAYRGWATFSHKQSAGLTAAQAYVNKYWFSLKFYIKDEKVKIELTDFVLEYTTTDILLSSESHKENIEIFLNQDPGSTIKQRQEKHYKKMGESAQRFNTEIMDLINSITEKLKTKSKFDF
jgi:hypothetical protein